MKALLIKDHLAEEFSEAHGMMPFNDNGDVADGSAWLIPLDEVPEGMMDNLDYWGEVVDAEERDYSPAEDESRPDWDTDWTGYTFSDHAFVRVEEETPAPKYSLTGRHSDHEKVRAFFAEALRESYTTWDDPEAVSELGYDEYFEATMDGKALYGSAELYPATLLISEDDFGEAEALFARTNASVWIERLRETGDEDLRGPGTLHVLETGGLSHESRYPKRVTSFSSENTETAEKLTGALSLEYDDKRFTLAEEKADGTLECVYSGHTVSL